MGAVLAELGSSILFPLYRLHPHLTPELLEQTFENEKQITSLKGTESTTSQTSIIAAEQVLLESRKCRRLDELLNKPNGGLWERLIEAACGILPVALILFLSLVFPDTFGPLMENPLYSIIYLLWIILARVSVPFFFLKKRYRALTETMRLQQADSGAD